jgi:IMP dehydrogenase
MAVAMARLGGIGVIHKNLSPERQAEEVVKVKHYLNGLIRNPVVFRVGMRLADILGTKQQRKYSFSGFPILDEQDRLAGILTARDVKFLASFEIPVDEVMTTELVVGGPQTTMMQAYELMRKHKVGKLPIVDPAGKLVGLYSFNDVKSLIANMEPAFNRDAQHQLRVAAAVGPTDTDRIDRLVGARVDALVVDTAHGHSRGVIDCVRNIKSRFPEVDVVAGNIATAEAAKALVEAGADAVKVGIGPGSICTTRVVAGVGVPQVTAIYDVRKAVGDEVPVIADGGIAFSGDVAKAVAVGADSVMMGSVLAGTDECPGEQILHQGRTYVVYRGMGSLDAMKSSSGSRERYGQEDVHDIGRLVPQGIEGLVPYRGSVVEVLYQFAGGLRYALGYVGARTIPEMQLKAKLVRVSMAGRQEAHPHDVRILKDAPNYQAPSD